MKKLAAVVRQGKSLAINTNYTKAPPKDSDPVAEVKKRMHSSQIEQYNAWAAGAAMPTLDWEYSHKTVSLFKIRSHFRQQLLAIQEIYHNPQLTRTNAIWFMSNFHYVIPLIETVAMVCVVRQEYARAQDYRIVLDPVDREALTEMEFAELKTARGIIKVTSVSLNREHRWNWMRPHRIEIQYWHWGWMNPVGR